MEVLARYRGGWKSYCTSMHARGLGVFGIWNLWIGTSVQITTGLMEGMVTCRVQYTQTKHHDMQRREVDFTVLHISRNFVSVFRWNVLSWAQSIELVPISGRLHQHLIWGTAPKFLPLPGIESWCLSRLTRGIIYRLNSPLPGTVPVGFRVHVVTWWL
jgi:hypothetical protein